MGAKTDTKKKRIGEMLIEARLVTQAQLQKGLERQKEIFENKGHKTFLGMVLVDLGFLNQRQLLRFTQKYNIKPPIDEILLMEGLISREQLNKALDIQKKDPIKKIEDILTDIMKVISHEVLLKIIAKQYGIPRASLKVSYLDPDFIFLFDQQSLLKDMFVPYRIFENAAKTRNVYEIVVSDVDNLELLRMRAQKVILASLKKNQYISEDSIGIKGTKVDVDFTLASKKEITRFIEHSFKNKEQIIRAKERRILIKENELQIGRGKVWKVGRNFKYSTSNQTTFFGFLMDAIDTGASDIHIEPMKEKLRIRFRIDGILSDYTELPKEIRSEFVRSLKMSLRFQGKDVLKNNKPLDESQDIYYQDKDIEFQIRISTIPVMYGDKMEIRILPQDSDVLDLEESGMSRNTLMKYLEITSTTNGIVIITGPTGSGKTTTIHATLCRRNTSEVNIVTAEDPIERRIDGINQTRVSGKKGENEMGYMEAFESIMRQDPDIIMVGEIRNQQSADMAIRAGMTGHLLFTTLHTNDAASAIARLLHDLKISTLLLSSTLVSIVGQRLVRKVCEHCKEKYNPNPKSFDFFAIQIKDLNINDFTFYRGKGCRECNNTGYKGRIAIVELLCVNDEIRRSVINEATAKDVEDIARKYGMTSMAEDAFLKIINGLTTVEEVVRISKTLQVPNHLRTVNEIRHLLEGELTNEEIREAVYSTKTKKILSNGKKAEIFKPKPQHNASVSKSSEVLTANENFSIGKVDKIKLKEKVKEILQRKEQEHKKTVKMLLEIIIDLKSGKNLSDSNELDELFGD